MPVRTCEICREHTAMYLCQNCGLSICPVCRVGWFCKNCSQETVLSDPEPPWPLRIGPVSLLFVAVAVILVGFVLVFIGSSFEGGFGGCFVWPLPFIVGCGVGSGSVFSGEAVFLLMVLAALLFFFFWLWSTRRTRLSPSKY